MWHSTPNYHNIYPTKNGFAKRMNTMLMENARNMLSGVVLTQELWVEAVNTTKYFVNRSPSSVLVNSTPHEVWLGKKPSLSHLKVFGYDTFVHVPEEKRNKLDNKAIKCIFINYKEGMKGFNLWDPVLRKKKELRCDLQGSQRKFKD
jgi:hypothetical protein